MASVSAPGGPTRPRIWPLIVTYLITWGLIWVPGILAGIYWGARFAVEKEGVQLPPEELSREFEAGFMQFVQSAGFLAFSTIAVGALMLALALIAAAASPVPLKQRLRLGRGTHARANAWIAGMLFCLAIGHLSTAMSIWIFGGMSEHLRLLEAIVAGASGALLVWLTLGLAVAAPVGEEFMFRGYMQSRLVERFGAAWGIAIASVAFAVVHLDPQHIVAALPIGVALGTVALRTGSIVPAVLAHALNNGIQVATAAPFPTESFLDDLGMWTAISLAASVATGIWFFRSTRPRPIQGDTQAEAAAASPP